MDLGLEGKTALVTGGSHGIGLAIALALAREGCKVHIGSRSAKHLAWALGQFLMVRHLFLGKAHQFDALDPASVDHLAQEVLEAGGVDILVNNVGGGGRWGSTPLETPLETWDQVFQKNARCAVQLTRALLPCMLERGWGRVVTVSSIHGREAGSNPWFMMAKSAEIALMKGLAVDPTLSGRGVTFNTVAPGYICIEGKDTEPSKGTPEDVASAVAFLCSVQARHVNGACLVVDGGEGKAF
jgi:3-oxoacyl-[acyl-carrier protein] reductase